LVDGQESLGSYKQFCKPNWEYIGADIVSGKNVDLVLEDGYSFPFADNEIDVIISGQTLEHIEYPWLWFTEMARILRNTCCIIAPAKIHEHKYPIDTFRYYPDGLRALAKWSNLKVKEVRRVVVDSKMEDSYLIATK
jgi:ubiquinone/menaquinone biosynthesis C-methylase UbiE